MKKIIALLITLCIGANIYAQISNKQATNIVNDYIKKLNLDEYLLYKKSKIVTSQDKIQTFDKEISTISNEAWVYFLDKKPLAGWTHKCSFIFIDSDSGDIEEKEWYLPPDNLFKWELQTKIKEDNEFRLFNFKKLDHLTSIKSDIAPENCYAIIISGGYDMSNNWQRYWNDCSAIYSVLSEVYNYPDNHIYTIMSDGTNPANDRRVNGGYDSSPLDLDGDGDNDIQYSATKSNITSVFNTLSGILDEEDFLFVFVTDHGGQENGQDSYLYLWDETIRDDQFADELDKVNAGKISVVMEQCYSGGFIDDLADDNRIITTACDYDETSCGMGYYTYDEFVFDWIAAVAGEDPNGNIVDADTDNNNYVSMLEAFNYAVANDNCAESPQFNSSPNNLGCYTSLDYYLDNISGSNIVCTTNSTFSFNSGSFPISISWTKSSNLAYVSGQGTSNYTVKASSSFVSESGWVEAEITTGVCDPITIHKDFFVGRPKFESTVVGPTQLTPGLSATYSISLAQGASNYEWEIPSGCYYNYCWNIKSGQGTNTISVQAGAVGSGAIECTAINTCGIDSRYLYVNVQDPNGGGDPCDPYMILSPNPNKGNDLILKIIYPPDPCDEIMTSINAVANVSIINNMGQTVYSNQHHGNNINIDGLHLLPGMYHVKYVKKNKIIEKSMIVE